MSVRPDAALVRRVGDTGAGTCPLRQAVPLL